jgi:hypothetical protein
MRDQTRRFATAQALAAAFIAVAVAGVAPAGALGSDNTGGLVVTAARAGDPLKSIRLPDGRIVHQTESLVSDTRLITVPGSPLIVALWNEQAAADAPREPWFAASLDGVSFAPARSASYDVQLKLARFDPLRDKSPVPAPSLAAGLDSELWIVQFVSPPLDPYRDGLAGAGATVQHFLPSNSYIVRMDEPASAAVAALPYVRWVGPYHPAYKADAPLLDSPLSTVNIQVCQRGPAQKELVAARIAALGGKVDALAPDGFLIRATLSRDQLLAVLRMNEVLWADRWGPTGRDMDKVRQISGANFLESTLGITGQGVRGEVMDDNFRSTHVDFQGPAPHFHGSREGATDHGTECYGICFGKGLGNAMGRGLLPGAEQGIFADKDLLTNRYTHTAQLVDPAGPYRAVFQSNSWGNDWTDQYTTISSQMDDILFINNIVLTQSMSNNGNTQVRPEAWAKNIIA